MSNVDRSLIARSSTNTHTYFFREPEAFDLLRLRILGPAREAGRRVSIWSAGCSKGDEPYTLAMVAIEEGVTTSIIASDINPKALHTARTGTYHERSLRYVNECRRRRFFNKKRETYTIEQDLRNLVTFFEMDIRVGAPPGQLDVVFCRNVLIYFNDAEKGQIISRLISALRYDGLLFLGASEWISTKIQNEVPIIGELEFQEVDGVLAYRRRTPDEMAARLPRATTCRVPVPVVVGTQAKSRKIDSVIEKKPDTDSKNKLAIEQLRVRGDRLLDTGDFKAAKEIYERALEIDSLLSDLHLRLAMTLLRQGEERMARDRLRRCLFLDANLWPASLLLGDLLFVEEPKAAERYFIQTQRGLEKLTPQTMKGVLAPFVSGRSAAQEAVTRRLKALRS